MIEVKADMFSVKAGDFTGRWEEGIGMSSYRDVSGIYI